MTNFEKFSKAWDKLVQENGKYEMMEYIEEEVDIPFGGEVVATEDEDISDSYDFTDTLLNRVVYFKDFDIHVRFKGRTQSYNGTEWDGYELVEKAEKVVNYFKTIE